MTFGASTLFSRAAALSRSSAFNKRPRDSNQRGDSGTSLDGQIDLNWKLWKDSRSAWFIHLCAIQTLITVHTFFCQVFCLFIKIQNQVILNSGYIKLYHSADRFHPFICDIMNQVVHTHDSVLRSSYHQKGIQARPGTAMISDRCLQFLTRYAVPGSTIIPVV